MYIIWIKSPSKTEIFNDKIILFQLALLVFNDLLFTIIIKMLNDLLITLIYC